MKCRHRDLPPIKPEDEPIESIDPVFKTKSKQNLQISYTHDGKSHSHYIPDLLVKQVEAQAKEYRRFKALVEEWVKNEVVVNR